MSRLSPHFHGNFWLALFALGPLAGCVDSGGPAQPSPGDLDAGAEMCETVLPTSCPSPAPSFKTDIKPIIAARCGSCHDGRGEQWPLVDYGHVADWAIEVRSMVADCSMPPADAGIAMPNSERQTILDWVRCDAPE